MKKVCLKNKYFFFDSKYSNFFGFFSGSTIEELLQANKKSIKFHFKLQIRPKEEFSSLLNGIFTLFLLLNKIN